LDTYSTGYSGFLSGYQTEKIYNAGDFYLVIANELVFILNPQKIIGVYPKKYII